MLASGTVAAADPPKESTRCELASRPYLVGLGHDDRLVRTPRTFRRLTGLTPAAFRQLLGEVTAADEQARHRRAARPGRRRKAWAGRTPALPLADRLLMLLIDYRTYTTHAVLGFLFGVDDSAVGRNINPRSAAVGRHLPHP